MWAVSKTPPIRNLVSVKDLLWQVQFGRVCVSRRKACVRSRVRQYFVQLFALEPSLLSKLPKPYVQKEKADLDTPKLKSQTQTTFQNPYVHKENAGLDTPRLKSQKKTKPCKNLTYISKITDLDTQQLQSQTSKNLQNSYVQKENADLDTPRLKSLTKEKTSKSLCT